MQRQEVERGHVVAVGLVRLPSQSPPFLILAKPQQILRELRLGRDIILAESQCLPLMRRALGEEVFRRELFADLVVHQRVGLPIFQAALARRPGFVRLVANGVDGGLQRPACGVVRIDLEDCLEDAFGLVVLLGVGLVVRLQQQRRDVVGVGEHRRVQRFLHLRRVALGVGLGQPIQQVGVLGIMPNRLRERPAGQLEVALGQGQFADCQQRLPVVGARLEHAVKQVLLHLLGVGNGGLEQRAPDVDERVLVANAALAVEELHDDLQHLAGRLGVAVGLVGKMKEPKRLGVVSVSVILQQLGGEPLGLGIRAGGQLPPEQQQPPAAVVIVGGDGLLAGLDGLDVLAGVKQLARLLQRRRPRLAKRQAGQRHHRTKPNCAMH